MLQFAHSIHLHPVLVHFPLTFFIAAAGFEIAALIFNKESFHRTAVYLYVIAAVISPLAVLTGLWEEDLLKIHHPVLETHERFGLITLGVALTSLPVLGVIKSRKPVLFRNIFLVFALLTAVTVSIAAFNGGKMVYEYGIGTEQ